MTERKRNDKPVLFSEFYATKSCTKLYINIYTCPTQKIYATTSKVTEQKDSLTCNNSQWEFSLTDSSVFLKRPYLGFQIQVGWMYLICSSLYSVNGKEQVLGFFPT